MNRLNDQLLTLKEVAVFLRIKPGYMYQIWTKLGIRPIVPYPDARPRFWKSDVIRMLDAQK